MAEAHYVAYDMANSGMHYIAEHFLSLPDYDPSANFETGMTGHEGQFVRLAGMNNSKAVLGMVRNGPFSQLLAHGVLDLVYALWNETFRKLVAQELGVKTQEIQWDIMGDLRIVRNMIIHNNCEVDDSARRLKLLILPEPGQQFSISAEMMQFIWLELKKLGVYSRAGNASK
jgi:hypothetical protein